MILENQILPASISFGSLKRGGVFELRMTVKNEDVMPNKIAIKNLHVNEAYEKNYLSWKDSERKAKDEANRPARLREMKVPFKVGQSELGTVNYKALKPKFNILLDIYGY